MAVVEGCVTQSRIYEGTPLPGFLDFGAWPAKTDPSAIFHSRWATSRGVLPGAPVACQVLLRHAARVQPPTPDRPHPADSFRCSLFRVREILGLFSGGARHSAARRGARVRTGAFTVRDQHAELERARVCCWSVLVQQPSHDVHCMVHGARALTRLARLARSDRQVPLSNPFPVRASRARAHLAFIGMFISDKGASVCCVWARAGPRPNSPRNGPSATRQLLAAYGSSP